MDGAHKEPKAQLAKLLEVVVTAQLFRERSDVPQANVVMAYDARQKLRVPVDLHSCTPYVGKAADCSHHESHKFVEDRQRLVCEQQILAVKDQRVVDVLLEESAQVFGKLPAHW